ALRPHQALLLCRYHAAAGFEVVEGYDLGPYEAALKVGVYLAGGLGGLGTLPDGPGPALVRAAGQEADESQQRVGALYEPVQAGLRQSQLLQELGLVLLRQLAYLLLDLRSDGEGLSALGVSDLLHRLIIFVFHIPRHARF